MLYSSSGCRDGKRDGESFQREFFASSLDIFVILKGAEPHFRMKVKIYVEKSLQKPIEASGMEIGTEIFQFNTKILF